MTLRRIYLLGLVLWIHLGDLLTASIYQAGAVPEVAYARLVRDAAVVLAAAFCLFTARMATSLLVPLMAYCGLVAASLAASLGAGIQPGIMLGSFGTLLIPILFFLVGYNCVRDASDIRVLVACYILIACLSAIFGVWEISNTQFWLDTVKFPAYLREVKGLIFGAAPETGLPHNFFADLEQTRRAAGLLAAPLAQGIVLVVAGVLVMATAGGRIRPSGALICLGLSIGIWMTGTRGAMVAGSIALTGYLVTARTSRAHFPLRIALALVVAFGILATTRGVLEATIRQSDGSSPGHSAAFQRNIEGILQIPPLGYGIGTQGPVAAQATVITLGGGEGAIFSIAYQAGLPAALAFLVLFIVCLVRLWRANRDQETSFALAAFWLMLGLATTLVTSDHVLAVSGSASVWILTGGVMRLLARTSVRERVAVEAHA